MTTQDDGAIAAYSKPIGRYSPVRVRHIAGRARTICISGQVAVDSHGRVQAENDPGGQAEIVFERLLGLLAQAGGRVEDLQSVTLYLTDRRHFDAVNAVRNRFFAEHAPASTLLIVELMEPGCLVELNGFAVVVDADGSEAT